MTLSDLGGTIGCMKSWKGCCSFYRYGQLTFFCYSGHYSSSHPCSQGRVQNRNQIAAISPHSLQKPISPLSYNITQPQLRCWYRIVKGGQPWVMTSRQKTEERVFQTIFKDTFLFSHLRAVHCKVINNAPIFSSKKRCTHHVNTFTFTIEWFYLSQCYVLLKCDSHLISQRLSLMLFVIKAQSKGIIKHIDTKSKYKFRLKK